MHTLIATLETFIFCLLQSNIENATLRLLQQSHYVYCHDIALLQ